MLEHYKKIGIWPQTSRISKTYEVRHSRAHTANGWYWNGHNSNTLTCFMLVFYYHSTLFNRVSQEKSAQKHVIFFLVGRWIPFWFSVPTPFIIQSIRLPVIIKSGIVARVGRRQILYLVSLWNSSSVMAAIYTKKHNKDEPALKRSCFDFFWGLVFVHYFRNRLFCNRPRLMHCLPVLLWFRTNPSTGTGSRWLSDGYTDTADRDNALVLKGLAGVPCFYAAGCDADASSFR